eukprot:PhF_6_TR12615/c0_g2_i2/m.19927
MLARLGLDKNRFEGSVVLPPKLPSLFLSLAHNTFFGPFDFTRLSTELGYLNLCYNQFSGNVSWTALTPSLATVLIDHNQFSGPVNFSQIHTNIELVELSNNSFSCTSAIPSIQSQRYVVESMCGDLIAVCPVCNANSPRNVTPTPSSPIIKRIQKSNSHNNALVDVASTLFVIQSQVVLSVQTMYVASNCQSFSRGISAGDTLRRPMLSWGRVWSFSNSNRRSVTQRSGDDDDDDDGDGDAVEVAMLFMTVASVYILHALATSCFILYTFMKSSRHQRMWKAWLHGVSKCGFPGNAINYHVTIVLPILSCCIMNWSYGTFFAFLVFSTF